MKNINNKTDIKQSGIMKKLYYIPIFLLFIVLISCCGCTDQEPTASSELLTINSIQDIDLLLEKSPVLIEIGAQRCPACREQKPIIDELASEYGDQIQFVHIDSDKQQQLAGYFNIYYIPDTIIIIEKDNNGYNYVTRYGTQTYNSQDAMMVGSVTRNELEVTIQHALRLRG